MTKRKREKNRKSKIYGKELILDLFECEPKIIRSKKKILEYINKTCYLIKVKKYSKAVIKRFGETSNWGKGYSFFQFITESSISGHFLEPQNIAYLNIFSCKLFDEKIVADFSQKFFKAKKIKRQIIFH